VREELIESQKVEGFPITPMNAFVYVVEYGQPDRTEGGIILGNEMMVGAKEDTQFGRYRLNDCRYGRVVAIGGGRPFVREGEKRRYFPRIPVKLGDDVLYNRRLGSRLGDEHRFKVPEYHKPLNVRVFSMDQIDAILEDFTPWWDVEESQLRADGVMTG